MGFPESSSQEKGNFPCEMQIYFTIPPGGLKSVPKLNAKQRLVTMTNTVTSHIGENPKPKLFPVLVDNHRRRVASLTIDDQAQLHRPGSVQLVNKAHGHLVQTRQGALFSSKLDR